MEQAKQSPEEQIATYQEISEDEFLAGEYRFRNWASGEDDANLLDIDPIFAKNLDRLIDELNRDSPRELDIDAGEPKTASLKVPGYTFVGIKGGVMLHAPDGTIAGLYVSSDVSVGTAHQGKGLGAELILERYLRSGDLPTWHLDAAAYSPAGEAAHRAAWRLLQDTEFLAKKIQSLDAF